MPGAFYVHNISHIEAINRGGIGSPVALRITDSYGEQTEIVLFVGHDKKAEALESAITLIYLGVPNPADQEVA